MKINIREVPEEGLSIQWSETDLPIDGVKTLSVQGFILPIQGGFDVSGEIIASVPMDCSFCAVALPIPVQEKFHEVLLLSSPKKGKSRPQKEKEEEEFQDTGVDEFYIEGNEIDIAPLIRDTIHTALPIQPKCLEKGAPKNYPNCKADWDYQSYLEKLSDSPLKSPFDALKNLKTTKKN